MSVKRDKPDVHCSCENAQAKLIASDSEGGFGTFAALGASNMHGVLVEMQHQAARSMEQFAAAAVKHNLPSVDISGKELPPAPALPAGTPSPPPEKSNLPLILGVTAVLALLIILALRQPPAYY